jgi:hypothetical protein
VQVVRATISQDLWRQHSGTRAVDVTLSMARVIEELRQAIDLKAKDRKLPPGVRSHLALALDATRLPGLGFDWIVREFRHSQGLWAASLGFKSIWLVGPITRLTWRLDSKDV